MCISMCITNFIKFLLKEILYFSGFFLTLGDFSYTINMLFS